MVVLFGWYYGVFQGCTTRDGTGGDTGNDTRVLLGVILGVVKVRCRGACELCSIHPKNE